MKMIDHAIDYVANRVLDRIDDRRPPREVHNIVVHNHQVERAPSTADRSVEFASKNAQAAHDAIAGLRAQEAEHVE